MNFFIMFVFSVPFLSIAIVGQSLSSYFVTNPFGNLVGWCHTGGEHVFDICIGGRQVAAVITALCLWRTPFLETADSTAMFPSSAFCML